MYVKLDSTEKSPVQILEAGPEITLGTAVLKKNPTVANLDEIHRDWSFIHWTIKEEDWRSQSHESPDGNTGETIWVVNYAHWYNEHYVGHLALHQGVIYVLGDNGKTLDRIG